MAAKVSDDSATIIPKITISCHEHVPHEPLLTMRELLQVTSIDERYIPGIYLLKPPKQRYGTRKKRISEGPLQVISEQQEEEEQEEGEEQEKEGDKKDRNYEKCEEKNESYNKIETNDDDEREIKEKEKNEETTDEDKEDEKEEETEEKYIKENDSLEEIYAPCKSVYQDESFREKIFVELSNIEKEMKRLNSNNSGILCAKKNIREVNSYKLNSIEKENFLDEPSDFDNVRGESMVYEYSPPIYEEYDEDRLSDVNLKELPPNCFIAAFSSCFRCLRNRF